MIITDNFQPFLLDYRWVLTAIFGAYTGILIIFVLRNFSDSLNKIEHLIDSGGFQKVKKKLLDHLTSKFYWIIVALFLFITTSIFNEAGQKWYWQSLYNETQLVSAYYFVQNVPWCILYGIFMYMIPIGLNLAYRDLCLRTSFKKDILLSEWMEPFKGFRRFITLIMFGIVIYAVFPLYIWGATPDPSVEAHWSNYVPYFNVTIILVSVVLFPHYYFHKLFSRAKSGLLKDLRRELLKISTQRENEKISKILLLLEKGDVEKMKTWLIDVKVLGEVLIVALMHVFLVEALTIFMHS